MLGKLLKYDMKYTSRIMSFVLLASLVTSIAFSASLFISFKYPIVGMFSFLMFFPFLGAVIVLSLSALVVTAVRIYKNFYSDEGYLTFTLPVTSTQLIISKVITFVFWYIVTSVAVILCFGAPILVLTYSVATEEILDFFKLIFDYLMFIFKDSVSFTQNGLTFFAVINVLNIIVSCISVPLRIMFAFSVGQLFNKYRLLISFLVYYLFNLVSNTLISIFDFIFSLSSSDLLVHENVFQLDLFSLSMTTLSSTVISTIITVALFLITRYIMSKKLNLI